ncbi:MAG: hypothetical protein AB7F89_06305 [Pirellulaceae bacterium]
MQKENKHGMGTEDLVDAVARQGGRLRRRVVTKFDECVVMGTGTDITGTECERQHGERHRRPKPGYEQKSKPESGSARECAGEFKPGRQCRSVEQSELESTSESG